MAIDKPPQQQARDPLAVKLKPKRGKSSRKQKQRMALKLDKVRPQSSMLDHSTCFSTMLLTTLPQTATSLGDPKQTNLPLYLCNSIPLLC